MKKYYWLIYSYENPLGDKNNFERLVDNHPFEYMNKQRESYGEYVGSNKVSLLNWKEISAEEYELYNI